MPRLLVRARRVPQFVRRKLRWLSRRVSASWTRIRRRHAGRFPRSSAPGAPKVFGIGLSKTGTTSLYAALVELGFSAITYRHLESRGLDEWWDGDFDVDYLTDVDAATDLPLGPMFRELDRRYPGSKFVLTERPIDDWLVSVERQLSGNPVRRGFNAMCRLAAYGHTIFNGPEFAYRFSRHSREVREHFADRPDDLLVMNVFEGDGWQELCDFLGRPVPPAAFPHVKPGYRAEASLQPIDATVPSRGRWDVDLPVERGAALIPLIHPNHPDVVDYREIEALLHRTCTSIRAQRGQALPAIIVGHQRPPWIDQVVGDVLFIDIGFGRVLDGSMPSRIDKGVKYVVGLIAAERWRSAEWVAAVDADDLVHVDLAAEVQRHLDRHPASTGVRWTRGAEVLLRRLDDGSLHISNAYEVERFDRVCGTSRAWRLASLPGSLSTMLTHFEPLRHALELDASSASSGYIRMTSRTGALLDSLVRSAGRQVRSELEHLGGHMTDHLGLDDLGLFGAAKCCGHGQHVGPQRGAIHVADLVRELDIVHTLASFGLLDGNEYLDIATGRIGS